MTLIQKLGTALIAALALASCGGQADTLTGSTSMLFSLKFDQVKLQIDTTSNILDVDYVKKNASGGDDDIANVAFDLAQVNASAGAKTDLAPDPSAANPKAIVTHNIQGEPHQPLPQVAIGSVTFDAYGTERVAGRFYITFAQTEGQPSTTLNGTFDQKPNIAAQ